MKSFRKGFGIITAVLIMMTVATLMSLMIGLSTSSVASTTKVFLKEEAEILMRSAAEYTMLAISGHDNTNSCVETIEIQYPNDTTPTHIVKIDIRYINSINRTACSHQLVTNLATAESDFTAIVDVTVEVQNSTGISEPFKIHRRTVQKP